MHGFLRDLSLSSPSPISPRPMGIRVERITMIIRKSCMAAAIYGANAAKEYPDFEALPKVIQDEINEIMYYIYSGGIFTAAEAPTAWWALEIQGLNLHCEPPKFAEGGLYQFYCDNATNKWAIWRMNRPDHAERFGHDIVDVYELDREEKEEC